MTPKTVNGAPAGGVESRDLGADFALEKVRRPERELQIALGAVFWIAFIFTLLL